VSVTVLLDPLGQQAVTLSLDDVSVGAHTFRAGNFVGELTVEPWYSDNPDIVQLVVRYGGSNALSSSASLPIYQAAKISEGNVKVALFSVGAIAALLAAIAIISVFSKEVHEGRRRLGVLRTIGASRSDIRRLVFPQALAVALSGAVLGMVAGAVIAGQLSSAGVFIVFGHELELSLGGGIVAVILLATVLISVSSALVSAELAARETAISSLKKLPEEPGEPVDVDALLGEE
jgi:ABC-type antimicrobial peptide transport system permease subunit